MDQPERRRGRPPKPPGKALVKVAFALKPEDVDFLAQLGRESFFALGGDPPGWFREERTNMSAVARHVINQYRVERAKRVKGGGGVWYYYVVGELQEDGRAEVEFRHLVTGETRRSMVKIATELPTLPPAEGATKTKPAGKRATAPAPDPRDVIRELPGGAAFNETAIHYAKVVGPEIFTPAPATVAPRPRAKPPKVHARAKQRR